MFSDFSPVSLDILSLCRMYQSNNAVLGTATRGGDGDRGRTLERTQRVVGLVGRMVHFEPWATVKMMFLAIVKVG